MSGIETHFRERPVRHPVGTPGDRIAQTPGIALEADLFASDLYWTHSLSTGAARAQWHEWVMLAEQIMAIERRRQAR